MFEEERGIIEIDVPEGFAIPECQRCGNRKNFYLEVESDHELYSSPAGLIEISQPKLSSELIGKKLDIDNIVCATCIENAEVT